MTIIEAINQADALKHNTYSQDQKVKWLSRAESMIKRLIIDTHEGGENVAFEKYDEDTALNTVLIAPEPFDELYIRYLEMQIDYTNGEIERYNGSAAMFHSAFNEFACHYHRGHLPRCVKKNFFEGGAGCTHS